MHVIEIAVAAHAGQVDKASEPYISHPMRVAEHVRRLHPGCPRGVVDAAWLHGVVEDSAWDQEQRRRAGVGQDVIGAVLAVTREPGEDPDAYYPRVRAHPWGLMVEHADLMDNSDPTRLVALPPATRAALEAKDAHAARASGLTLRCAALRGAARRSAAPPPLPAPS